MIITHTNEGLSRVGMIVPICEVLDGEYLTELYRHTPVWQRVGDDLLDIQINRTNRGYFKTHSNDKYKIIITNKPELK